LSVVHKSVLPREVLEFLRIKKGEIYIDATFGGGGHAKRIMEFGARVLGIDMDPEAIKEGSRLFSVSLREEGGQLYGNSDKLILVQGNLADIGKIAKRFGVWETPGILFDFGLSSDQIERSGLGLSFLKDEPLDMRLDPSLTVKAADLVNGLNQGELYELFNKFGEEPNSRRIASNIVESRIKRKIETSKQLAEIIERVVFKKGKIHPATRVFQALRIAVNDELNNLKKKD